MTGILGPETEIMKGTPWSRIQGTKQRGQRILGDCWQWDQRAVFEGRQLQFPTRYE